MIGQWNWRQKFCGIWITTIGLFSPAFAQEPPAKTIEIYQGGVRQGASRSTPPPPRASVVPGGLVSPTSDSSGRPLPPQAAEMAATLVLQSTDAFERGLLPLEDYLEHLRFVSYVERRRAMEHQHPSELKAAARRHMERVEHAAMLLQAFRQPAAEGWEAETLLAQAVAAEATAEFEKLNGNRQRAELATQEFQNLALRHLDAREFDAQILGIGSLPTLAAAVELVAKSNGNPDAETAVSQTLQKVLVTTERWNAEGAGLGRADEVDRAQAAEARNRGHWALISKDLPEFSAAVQDAEQASLELYETRLEFYQTGTASLADLTEALLVRNRVHQLAATGKDLLSPEMDNNWERDLHQTVELSRSIEDRRGRIASDVQFLSLLNLIDATDRDLQ